MRQRSRSTNNPFKQETSRVSKSVDAFNPQSNQLSNSDSASIHQSLLSSIPKKAENLQLFNEGGFVTIIDNLENNVYKKMMKKLVNEHLPKNLKFKKIISSQSEFNSEAYEQDINKKIQSEIDSFQSWVRFNIAQREEVERFKQKLIEKEERKAKKYQDIYDLLQKIVEKHQKKKVEELIAQFKEARKRTESKFQPNPQLKQAQERTKRLMNMPPEQPVFDLQNAQKVLDQFKNKLRQESGLNLDVLENMKLKW